MKNVLVTGGLGFIGKNLVKHLLKTDPTLDITILDNLFTSKCDKEILEKVTFINESTWNIDDLMLFDFDTIFHFGEYPRIVQSFKDIDYVLKSNLTGTSRILEYCRRNNAKLIYSASSSKFGNDGKDENLSPYAWVKAKNVELIKNYHDWYNLDYEITYFFNVYGPGQIKKGDYATVIGIFEKLYSKGKPLTVVSPGTQSRDFTHVEDIVEGVYKAAISNKNKEWFLRSGKNVSIIDVAEMFNHKWKLVPERRGERLTSFEFENDTQEVLNWKPKWELETYIKNFIS